MKQTIPSFLILIALNSPAWAQSSTPELKAGGLLLRQYVANLAQSSQPASLTTENDRNNALNASSELVLEVSRALEAVLEAKTAEPAERKEPG